MFSCAAGLMVGKEGPMIHTGAILGAVMPIRLGVQFRSDLDKRDFVSIGCACGVAGAFGAPFGGVLFVLEEAASHWRVELTWMTTMATAICCIAVMACQSLDDGVDTLSDSSLVSFGSFEGASIDERFPKEKKYTFGVYIAVVIFGLVGGVLGAIFNQTNMKLAQWRGRLVTEWHTRLFEVALLSLVSSCLLFGLALLADDCTAAAANLPFYEFSCPEGQSSPVAALALKGPSHAVWQLFHSTEHFDNSWLLALMVVVMFLTILTYGICVPSGLFVPAILIGSFGGRLAGQLLHDGKDTFNLNPGIYALLGGAAMLAGVTRMTISITMILVECTNNSTYVVPLAIVILIAKGTGDFFNHGLYDIYLKLGSIYFLEEVTELEHHKLRASDVMHNDLHPEVVVLREVETVARLEQILQSCPHTGFPVVLSSQPDKKTFCGIVLRSQLTVLLKHREIFSQPKNVHPTPTHPLLHRAESGRFDVRTSEAQAAPWFQGGGAAEGLPDPCSSLEEPTAAGRRSHRLHRGRAGWMHPAVSARYERQSPSALESGAQSQREGGGVRQVSGGDGRCRHPAAQVGGVRSFLPEFPRDQRSGAHG
eukprot:TRINITY_DN9615_c0_g1_i3.p1 TRINITY_DN9615_c0_g1~~TRINITY_DN9615_c0_g1_i3.p1  ORF type:complete len:594 (-),score=115.59 TRINITY_DN9615_c0_g1_i3:368-2149(-)